MSEFSKPVLAFDSALGGCVVAVVNGDRVHSASLETEREQAAKLMPMVQELVSQAGVEFSNIGLIVTSVGPGSFTGLRISLSAARALGLALNVPVQGVSTFEAMARSVVKEAEPCLVVLETKREDFYVQAFDADKNPEGEAACLSLEVVREIAATGRYILCGDGLERLGIKAPFSRMAKMFDPDILAHAGLSLFLKNGGRAERPEPVYLRGADVSMSNKVQREIKDLPI